eukprot:Skav214156  [mRNA]  locus=scaffold945:68507:80179:- [translate_table: standard]
MTRRVTMKGQKMGASRAASSDLDAPCSLLRAARCDRPGTCIDWDSPEHCPCGEHAACGADGYCEVKTWCPIVNPGDGNVANPPPGAVVEDILGLEDAVLMIVAGRQGGIGFPSIGQKFHVAGARAGCTEAVQDAAGVNLHVYREISPDSSTLHKHITVAQLLELADPPMKLQDVAKTGSIIAVNFFWNCDLSWVSDSMRGTTAEEPSFSVKRVDDGTGFVQKRAKKSTLQGQERGMGELGASGLRLIVDSSGIGRQISLVPIVIQLGSCLALVQIASMAADFLMAQVRMYDKDRRDAYYKCKVPRCRVASLAQERLDLVGDQRTRAREMVAAGQVRSGGAGAAVQLGLGAGARGSMAAALRGRNVGARGAD